MGDVNTDIEERQLDHLNARRMAIIDKNFPGDKAPEDPVVQGVVLKAIADGERTIMTKARLRISAKDAENGDKQTELLEALINTVSRPTALPHKEMKIIEHDVPDNILEVELVEGEDTLLENVESD